MSWLVQALQGLQDYRMVVFGPLLILCIMFCPTGIVGAVEARFARRRAALAEKRLREAATPPPVPPADARGSHA